MQVMLRLWVLQPQLQLAFNMMRQKTAAQRHGQPPPGHWHSVLVNLPAVHHAIKSLEISDSTYCHVT